MKLSTYKVMFIAPLPVALIVGYYGGSALGNLVEKEISFRGKEIATPPDFEVVSIKATEEVSLLALIDIEPKRKEPVQSEAQEKVQDTPPFYKLSFLYIGQIKRYAIINGMLVEEGSRVSHEEKVLKITKEGVLLSGKWGKRWLKLSD